MKKTRLGCTILEGNDVANLPLVSQNAEILDTEIDRVDKKIGSTNITTILAIETVDTKLDKLITDNKKEHGNLLNLRTTEKSNIVGSINELFQNVSDGKQVVATAITGKGVPTSGSDTFSKMATNIGAIETDKTGDSTALANDILAPKTAYSEGVKLVGTIPSKIAQIYTPGITSQLIEAGQYLSGRQTIAGVTVPVANVLVGTTIAGQTGTMPNIGKQTGTITINNVQIAISKGYHDGTGFIQATFANLIASNIKKEVNIGGIIGTYAPTLKTKTVSKETVKGQIISFNVVNGVQGENVYIDTSSFAKGNGGLIQFFTFWLERGQSNIYDRNGVSYSKITFTNSGDIISEHYVIPSFDYTLMVVTKVIYC